MSQINYAAMEERDTFVPEHMRDGFKLWIENGIHPGSFGMAIIENDLKAACSCADIINRNHIFTIVAWFWNYAPCDCWGGHEKAFEWNGINR